MIDLETQHCEGCQKLIPINKKFCYICDLVINGVKTSTPKDMKQLIDDFLNNCNEVDFDIQDIDNILTKFNAYIESKNYRITIQ